jgi:hypothetical protein
VAQEGGNLFEVYGKDSAGNPSATEKIAWTVDLTSPIVVIDKVNPPEKDSTVDFIEISFSVSEAAAVANCNLNQQGFSPCRSPYLVGQLADGQHEVLIQAQDLAGNKSKIAVYQWTIQTVLPVQITHTEPSSKITKSKSATFEFSSALAKSFQCQMDQVPPASCTSPYSVSGLTDGKHRFEVRAMSPQGKLGPADFFEWEVDTVAPAIKVTSIFPSDLVTREKDFKIFFEADGASFYTCQLDAGVENKCTSPLELSQLSLGDHTLKITATDEAGNQSNSFEHRWKIEPEPLALSNIAIGQVTKSTAVVRWNTNLASSSRIEYTKRASGVTQAMNVSDLVTNHTLTLSGLESSSIYDLIVISEDPVTAQKQSSQTLSLVTLR